jgi:TPR repeat protein
MFNLGNLHLEEGDVNSTRRWWNRAAQSGHAATMANLGFLLMKEGDTESARTWLTRAAEAGGIAFTNGLHEEGGSPPTPRSGS